MFDNIFQQVLAFLGSFSNSDITQGVVGVLVFIAARSAIMLIPRSIRGQRIFWFVEVILLPLVLLANASILLFVLEKTGVNEWSTGSNYVSSVGLVLVFAYLLNQAVKFFIWEGVLLRKTSAIPAIVKTVVSALVYTGGFYIIIAIIYNQPVTGLVIYSGVLIGVLGLAFQPVLGDIIAGISLTIERPFVPGDWIELDGGILGEVVSTDWRATRVLTYKNTVHVIPNGRLSNVTIHNLSEPDETYGFWFLVPDASSVSPSLVIQLLTEAAIKSNSVHDDPKPHVRISDVKEQPTSYKVFVYCKNYDSHFAAKSEVLENAWQMFDRAGFSFAAREFEGSIWRGQPAQGSEPRFEDVLDEIKLLSPLTKSEKQSLVDTGVVRNYSSGDTIVVQGDEGNSAFIILAGMVRVHQAIEEENDRQLELARLGMFDFFGEMSLLTGAPRFANVAAYTDCKLIEIPKACLETILGKRPELADELAHLMAERKLQSEVLSSENHQKSMGEALTEYKEIFARTIREFFVLR